MVQTGRSGGGIPVGMLGEWWDRGWKVSGEAEGKPEAPCWAGAPGSSVNNAREAGGGSTPTEGRGTLSTNHTPSPTGEATLGHLCRLPLCKRPRLLIYWVI